MGRVRPRPAVVGAATGPAMTADVHAAPPPAPVLVVGAGPVGCVLALELARHGVRSILLERALSPSRHPKMDYVNGRTMELFRRLGLAEDVRARGVGAEHSFNFIWSRSFSEPPISVWEYPSVAEATERIAAVNDGSTPVEAYQRVQGSLLEELLRQQARENRFIDLREGWMCMGVRETAEDGVTATVVDTKTGSEHTLRARYLGACDGANSVVRQSLGIPVEAVAPPTNHCDVYFKSADRTLRRHGRAFLTIIASGLTLVSRDENDTWTGTFPLLGDEVVIGDPVRLMLQKLGAEVEIQEVLNVARWQGTLAVASSYRQGSAFLVGDSAHQFYPTGGHGANTGVADAVDLGWKLAACLNGWGGPALLDSYEAERRPVALFIREMCANLLEVWRRFSQLARDGASREHLAGFLEHETYQMDNVGIHFGYRYARSPVICSEDGEAPPWRWSAIVPTTWPGGRAPTLRLDDGSLLFDRLGPEFTLVDVSGASAGEVMVKEALRRGMPVEHLVLEDPRARRVWERDLVLVRPDQHVCWRGARAPDDVDEVLDRVRGC